MYKECKTHHSRQRQRAIMNSYVELLEKTPIDSISVTSLCAYAKIPRKAFYRYFDTLNDLINYWADCIISEMRNELNRIRDPKDQDIRSYLQRFFEYWYKHRSTIHIIRKNQLSNQVFSRMTLHVTDGNKTSFPIDNKKEQDQFYFLMYILSSSLISVLYLWDNENYKYSIKEMTNTTYQLLTNPLL